MVKVNQLRQELNILSAKQLENKEVTSSILAENH